MKKLLVLCVLLSGCSAIFNVTKYKGWEYVRIENNIPDKSCVYKVQEACSMEWNQCLDWHKKHAITYGANTVVITQKEIINTQHIDGDDRTNTLAEYYFCNGAKNISPS